MTTTHASSSSSPVCNVTHRGGTLRLPKKTLLPSSGLRAGLLHSVLSGPLYHRYKPRKWSRLRHCLLTPDAHLFGFRSSHLLTPTVALFVSALSSAVYAGRDSGMEHVIKITHPNSPRKATVFAADSRAEAMAWIDKINQIAKGIEPKRVCGQFSTIETMDLVSCVDFTRPNSTFDMTLSDGGGAGDGVQCHRGGLNTGLRPKSLYLPNSTTPCRNSLPADVELLVAKRQSTDLRQEDSGFSGLLSSSSSMAEGTNGDVYHRAPTPNQQVHIAVPSSSSRNSTIDSFQSRASCIFSSVRKKVESFSSRRKSMIILPGSAVESNSNSPRMTGVLESSEVSASVVSQHPTPCERERSVKDRLVGFGWALLESGVQLLASCESPSPSLKSVAGWKAVSRRPPAKVASNEPHRKLPHIDSSSALVGGVYISIPNRLPWTRRWCALRSSVLEIFASPCGPVPTGGPIFSLPLQPNLVEVSLAGDKHHPSAIRLSASSLSSVTLLLDTGDTSTMGNWIRAIIQALGLITKSTSTGSFATPSLTPPTCQNSRSMSLNWKSHRYSDVGTPCTPMLPSSSTEGCCCSSTAFRPDSKHLPQGCLASSKVVEALYDEVASPRFHVVPRPKRWSLPPCSGPLRLSEVIPLPPLPSAGHSSGSSSSIYDDDDPIYSSVYISTNKCHFPKDPDISGYDGLDQSLLTVPSPGRPSHGPRRTRSLSSISSRCPSSSTGRSRSCSIYWSQCCYSEDARAVEGSSESIISGRGDSPSMAVEADGVSNRPENETRKPGVKCDGPVNNKRFMAPNLTSNISDAKVISFLRQTSDPTTVASPVARSFSCMSGEVVRGSAVDEKEMEARGLTFPLGSGHSVQFSSPLAPFKATYTAGASNDQIEGDLTRLTTSQLDDDDDLEHALLALDAATDRVCSMRRTTTAQEVSIGSPAPNIHLASCKSFEDPSRPIISGK